MSLMSRLTETKRNLVAQILYAINHLLLQEESSDEETSEDENEQMILFVLKRKRNLFNLKPIRIHNYLERTIPNYSRQQFQSHFRLTFEAYSTLLSLIGPLLKRQTSLGRQTINIEKQLLSVIWLLATPDSYR